MRAIKNGKNIIIAFFTIIFLASSLITVSVMADTEEADTEQTDTKDADTVKEGVFIEDIDISGMTYDEAVSAVEEYVSTITSAKFILNINDNEASTKVGKLGYSWDNTDIVDEAVSLGKSGNVIKRYKDTLDLKNEGKVYELEMSLDKDTVSEKVVKLCEPYNIEAQNATLKRENDSFVITEEQEGLIVDEEATTDDIYTYITEEWDRASTIILDAVTKVDEPEITAEDCELVSTSPMGTYTTYFSTGGNYANRCLNIKNGAEHLDASVVYPGEQYSVNEHLTARTAENGYYLAGTYVDGTVQDSYGGGICQVSSTLYNALLLAEIDIVERYPHSMSVSYVPLSQDAAIAGDYKDLVFENNTDAPLYIEAIFSSGGSITFNVYGHETRASNRTVKYVSETTSTTPAGVEVTESDEYPEGYEETVSTGHTGYTAKLWKYVYEDGVEVSKEQVNSSTYAATDTQKIVGTGKAEDDEDEDGEDGEDTTEEDEEDTTKEKSTKNDKETTTKSSKKNTEEKSDTTSEE